MGLTFLLNQHIGAVVKTGCACLVGKAGGGHGEDGEEHGGELHLDSECLSLWGVQMGVGCGEIGWAMLYLVCPDCQQSHTFLDSGQTESLVPHVLGGMLMWNVITTMHA